MITLTRILIAIVRKHLLREQNMHNQVLDFILQGICPINRVTLNLYVTGRKDGFFLSII